jgi:hypothetical protein
MGTLVKGLIAFSTMPRYDLQVQNPGPIFHTKDWLYKTNPSIDDYYFFDVYVSTGWKKLIGSVQENYIPNDTVQKTDLFNYDFIEHPTNPHSNLTGHSICNSDGKVKIINYQYPADKCLSDLVFQNMIDRHCINKVIEKGEYLDLRTITIDNISYRDEMINKKQIIVPDAATHRIYTYKSSVDNNLYDIEEYQDKYIVYDFYGNILQYVGYDDIDISYLWGYSHQYPIAKIKNATYEQVIEVVDTANIHSLANADDDHCREGEGCDEDNLRSTLSALRNK